MVVHHLPRGGHAFHVNECLSPKSQSLAALHDSSASPAWQHTHFNTYFVRTWRLSQPIPPRVNLFECLRILRNGLRKMATSRVWLAIQVQLKVRSTIRRYAVPICRRLRLERERVLEEWLEYWRACEAKSQGVLRARRISGGPALLAQATAAANSLARVSICTPEWLKPVVLWDLYWLLRAQHSVKALAHWRRWGALQRRRAELRRLARENKNQGSDEPENPTEVLRTETMSLPAVNAAIFVMALQPPRFHATAGKHVKVQDLVRLANGHLNLDFSEFGDIPWVELQHIPPTVSPFLSSSLCDDPNWIRQRCLWPVPIIPPAPTPTPAPGDHSLPTSRRGSVEPAEGIGAWGLQRPSSLPEPSVLRSKMPLLSQPQRRASQCMRLPGQLSLPGSPNVNPAGSPCRSTSPKPILPDLQSGGPRRLSTGLRPIASPGPLVVGRARSLCVEALDPFPMPPQKAKAKSLPLVSPLHVLES